MGSTSSSVQRPSQLSVYTIALLCALVVASFATGIFLWWANSRAETTQDELRTWMSRARMLHGAINPILAVLYGWILSAHASYGIRIRANLKSGLSLLSLFGALILTGAGIYYASGPTRTVFIWTHQLIGILLPISIALHWLSAISRQKRIQSNSTAYEPRP